MPTLHGRAACTFVLAAMTIAGTLPCPAADAAGRSSSPALKTFADPRYGYTLHYPTTWKLQPDARIADLSPTDALLGPVGFILQAPSGNDGVALIVKAGKPTAGFALLARALLAQGVTIQGAIRYGTRTIGGVVFQSAQAMAKSTNGALGQETVLRGTHGKHTYGLLLVLILNQPTTPQRRAEIVTILANIAFT